MSKELIVSATSLEKKLAILEDDQVIQIFIERDQNKSILGNIYKGRVTRVLPGMQAAFVDIGLDRNAFLYVSDFFEDYEDYEELFKATEASPEEFLADSQEIKETRKTRRSRRTRRSPAKAPSVQQVSAPLPAESPVVASQSGIKRPEHVDTARPQVLPLELYVAAEGVLPSGRRQSRSDPPGILPDQFGLLVDEAVDPSTVTPVREARLDSKPDLQHFTLSNANRRRKNEAASTGPLIGDLLKEGQEVLVQVAKEPIGRKGARITSHIVFPGRYLVFMPTVDHVGVSRRIESAKERQRLRDLILDLRGDVERGFIVRTAGEGRSRADFRQDMVYLTRLWESIRSKFEKKAAPALIHTELDLVQRVIRDFFSDDYRAMRVDDEDEYERIVEFVSNFNPSLVKKIRLYSKRSEIFDDFRINTEIEQALKSKVWLKNGGYIVINQTEALVAIDVNTGKYVGRTNSLEDTIARTNLDAVREVIRQIRLRDLGGIIIIDFIDMNDARNQARVMEALQQELQKDKSPSKVLPFNEFGLVAITRKRVKQSLERTLCQPCVTCEGSGMTKSVRTICYTIHAEVRRAIPTLVDGRELIIRCHPDVGQALRGTENRVRQELEEMTGKQVTVMTDPLMHIEQFDLVEA